MRWAEFVEDYTALIATQVIGIQSQHVERYMTHCRLWLGHLQEENAWKLAVAKSKERDGKIVARMLIDPSVSRDTSSITVDVLQCATK